VSAKPGQVHSGSQGYSKDGGDCLPTIKTVYLPLPPIDQAYAAFIAATFAAIRFSDSITLSIGGAYWVGAAGNATLTRCGDVFLGAQGFAGTPGPNASLTGNWVLPWSSPPFTAPTKSQINNVTSSWSLFLAGGYQVVGGVSGNANGGQISIGAGTKGLQAGLSLNTRQPVAHFPVSWGGACK